MSESTPKAPNPFQKIIDHKNAVYQDTNLTHPARVKAVCAYIVQTLKELLNAGEKVLFRNCFYSTLIKLEDYMASDAQRVFSSIATTVGDEEDLRTNLIKTCDEILRAKRGTPHDAIVTMVRDTLKNQVVDLTKETPKRGRDEEDDPSSGGGPAKKVKSEPLGPGERGTASASMTPWKPPVTTSALAPFGGDGGGSMMTFNPAAFAEFAKMLAEQAPFKEIQAAASLAQEQSLQALQQATVANQHNAETTKALQEIRQENAKAQENLKGLSDACTKAGENAEKTTQMFDKLMNRIETMSAPPPAAPASDASAEVLKGILASLEALRTPPAPPAPPAVDRESVIAEYEGEDIGPVVKRTLLDEFRRGVLSVDGFREKYVDGINKKRLDNEKKAASAAKAAAAEAAAEAAKAAAGAPASSPTAPGVTTAGPAAAEASPSSAAAPAVTTAGPAAAEASPSSPAAPAVTMAGPAPAPPAVAPAPPATGPAAPTPSRGLTPPPAGGRLGLGGLGSMSPEVEITVSMPFPHSYGTTHVLVMDGPGYRKIERTELEGRAPGFKKEGMRCLNPPTKPEGVPDDWVYMRHMRRADIEDWYPPQCLAESMVTYRLEDK
jgi:hypothetical protein